MNNVLKLTTKVEDWYLTPRLRYLNKGLVLDKQILQQAWQNKKGDIDWRNVEIVYEQ